MSSLLPRVLAVVPPVVVLAAVLLAIRVHPRNTHDLQQMIGRFAATGPEVVIVGNSRGEAAIDPHEVRASPGDGVEAAFRSGSMPPHWWSTLQRAVYEPGHRPAQVVFYVPPDEGRRVTLTTVEQGRLMDLLRPDDEPVIDKTFGGSRARMQLAWASRTRLAVRSNLVDYAERPGGFVWEAFGGDASGDRALDGRIGNHLENGLKMRLNVERDQATPIVNDPRKGLPNAIRVEESLLPDLVDLVKENGGRPIFIWATRRPADRGPCRPEGAEPDTTAFLLARGADVVDLTWLDVPPGSFFDAEHAGPAARDRVTQAVGDAVRALRSGEPGRHVPPRCAAP